MKVSALFLDLDDTLFPSNIPYNAFERLFSVIDENKPANWDKGKIEKVKADLWNKTFREAAEIHGFSEELTMAYLDRLNSMNFEFRISLYPDYRFIKPLTQRKYLITSGSRPVQEAKIRALGIKNDFIRICYDDPFEGSEGKASIFTRLLDEEGLDPAEVLVIGDNEKSEIQAARQLDIDFRIIDRENKYPQHPKVIRSFSILNDLLI